MKKPYFLFVLIVLFSSVCAAESFVVHDIRVDGLQRIQLGTVLNYLPVQEGETLDTKDTARLIRELYETGLFQHVELQRKGNTLIIRVVERATINRVQFSGNWEIKTEQLKGVLKQINLVEGQTFQRSTLEQFKQELLKEYYHRGKYNAVIDAKVTPIDQNQVTIDIKISEGRTAKINKIRIIGNHSFRTENLVKQMQLSTSNLLSFLTRKDYYSKEKLDASLESLQSFYMDHGYIRFRVESKQVLLSPDKKRVHIDIKIHEGARYTFSGYKLLGKLVLPRQQVDELVSITAGEVYSRQVISDAIEAIGHALGNKGYGFPQINAEPNIDEKSKQVFVTFVIRPGQQVYVRRINFSGNTLTTDDVLRRAMRQNEGALLSLSKVKASERQLRILGYLQDVQVRTIPVPGVNNQVDLEFQVQEAPSAEAKASIGYGTNGFEFDASFNQYNFMGTGRTVGINFNSSRWARSYQLNYYNPYYTISGIGRGFRFYYQTTTPGKQGVSEHTTDKYGGFVDYHIPYSDHTSFKLGAGLDHLNITSLGANPANQLRAFTDANGFKFTQVRLSGGWRYNTYDRMPFPNEGLNSEVHVITSLPADSAAFSYYKLNYNARYYQPLTRGFILTLLGNVGYGNRFDGKGLPFFENYYAGGIITPGQVRGYESYSLGPKDSRGSTMGGNFLTSASVGLVLPYPFSRDMTRTMGFIDAGNVYSRGLPEDQRGGPSGPWRYSAGVALEWHSPFGPLVFSLATPLNSREGDEVLTFQFSGATNF